MIRYRVASPLLAALAIVAAAAAASFAAVRFANTRADDLGTFGGMLVATGWFGLALAWVVRRWSRGMGSSGRILLFLALAIGLFAANIAVAAAFMFISSHDLKLLLVLSGYAMAATAVPALIIGRDLGRRLSAVEIGAAQIASGDLSTRVRVSGADDIARLASAFNSMAAELQAADERRDAMEHSRRELFASISHDLRTPLSSIRVMVEAISDGVVADEETVRRYLSNLSGDVGRLSTLIDDLFELATIDSGALQLRLELVAMEEVVAAAVDAARVSAEQASVAVLVEPGPPTTLMLDPNRLTRVLANLLQNAIRHTPPDGSVVVSTRTSGGEVLVTVADTGEGIPPEDAPRVFDRFYRVEKSRSRAGGGSGLGLSICRGIVEAHGGRIWIDPTNDQGTAVTFALPAR